jgi:uncharacterized membrane protein YqjE
MGLCMNWVGMALKEEKAKLFKATMMMMMMTTMMLFTKLKFALFYKEFGCNIFMWSTCL